jgi:hypothetical protein
LVILLYNYNFLDIISLRKPFQNIKEQEFSNWIKEKILNAKLANDKGYNFMVQGHPICAPAFCAIYGISDYKWKKSLESLSVKSSHGNKGKIRQPKWRLELIKWFLFILAQFCDFMPNSNTKYLPTYFTQQMMHSMASNHILSTCGVDISESRFRSFWKENYKDIKIPKNFKMGRCDYCLELKRKKSKGASYAEINQYMEEHNKLHSSMREYCNNLREKATIKPFKYMFLQYDGKQASRLPHIIPLPKDTQTLPRIKLNVYGVSNFSENCTQFYTFFPHWETGSNVSCSILYDHILRSFQKMKHKRPSTLILQVDNCAKEGKNKTVFAFAAHLIHFGWFKKIKIVSLIQGHTHDLIDQEFSVWSTGERKKCIESLYHLGDFIKTSFSKEKKSISYTVLRWMFDWTKYFEDVICKISNYKDARMFKLYQDDNGQVLMKYKTNCMEKTWRGFELPDDSTQYGIRVCSSFKSSLPQPILPQPLPIEDLNIISERPAFVECYEPKDKAFWLNLAQDSTSYLKNNTYFSNEGKFYKIT